MAGIGSALRKLAAQDNFTGIVRAFIHSAIAAVGPWILIVVTLGMIYASTGVYIGFVKINNFQAVVVYNFFFSFILSGPLYLVTARYVSDCLYLRDPYPIPGILLTSLFLLIVPAVMISALFYFLYSDMDRASTLFSIANFVLLCEVWLVMLFLGCIRNFRAITISWIGGMLLTVYLTISLGKIHGVAGMLAGLDIGLILLLALLQGNIFAEYPYSFQFPKDYGFYFKYYKGLFWSGVFLNAGMWIDKIIMWSAPEALRHQNYLITYPTYDGAMFISYLSIIPAAAYFIYSLETNFYESYIQYIENVERNASLDVIESTAREIVQKIKQNGRTMIVLQGILALVLILTAPQIFQWFGFNFIEIAIFRFGVLGAFFTVLNLFIVILFSYFDNEARMLIISFAMLTLNIIFTFLSKKWGFPYYGLGYCISMILTFLLAGFLLVRFLGCFTYHIFISNVVKRRYEVAKKISTSGPLNSLLFEAKEKR